MRSLAPVKRLADGQLAAPAALIAAAAAAGRAPGVGPAGPAGAGVRLFLLLDRRRADLGDVGAHRAVGDLAALVLVRLLGLAALGIGLAALAVFVQPLLLVLGLAALVFLDLPQLVQFAPAKRIGVQRLGLGFRRCLDDLGDACGDRRLLLAASLFLAQGGAQGLFARLPFRLGQGPRRAGAAAGRRALGGARPSVAGVTPRRVVEGQFLAPDLDLNRLRTAVGEALAHMARFRALGAFQACPGH